jgi:hypothetical protein
MAHDPSLTPFEVRAKLVGSADRKPGLRLTTARGRLNAAAALTYEDATPPQTRIRKFKRIGPRKVRFRLGANEIVRRFECRIDGGPYEKCRALFKSGALSKGSHAFRARAVDAFGNADPTPAFRRFVIR